MARALKDGELKVERLVHYVTASGVTRPAVITALVSANLVDLRVGRHAETYSSKDLMANQIDTDVWYAGSRRRYD